MVGICADPGIHQVRRPARPFPDLRRSRWALAVASGTSWGHRRASAAILDAACALVGVCLTSWSGTPGIPSQAFDRRSTQPPTGVGGADATFPEDCVSGPHRVRPL